MMRAEDYRHLADNVRARARTAESKKVAAEWERLADCYARLAKQTERHNKADEVAPRDGERRHN